jgi:hypothetical protein
MQVSGYAGLRSTQTNTSKQQHRHVQNAVDLLNILRF